MMFEDKVPDGDEFDYMFDIPENHVTFQGEPVDRAGYVLVYTLLYMNNLKKKNYVIGGPVIFAERVEFIVQSCDDSGFYKEPTPRELAWAINAINCDAEESGQDEILPNFMPDDEEEKETF